MNSTQLCSQRCGRATYTKHEPGNAFSTFFAPRGGCGCAEYEFQRSTQKHAQRPLIIFFCSPTRRRKHFITARVYYSARVSAHSVHAHTSPFSQHTNSAHSRAERERASVSQCIGFSALCSRPCCCWCGGSIDKG